jgi:hypothetical protein
MVRDRIAAHKAAGVTTIRVQPEGSTVKERAETLARVVAIAHEA